MGRIVTFRLGIKPLTQSPRKVWAYLPNDYDESDRVYPVLYMFDGHNLFSDKVATYGKCWGIKDYLDKENLPLVVIGADCNHTGNKRLEEYLPLPIEKKSWIGNMHAEGDITAAWFAEHLKPYCEKRFRISKDRKDIGIGGSSMGGLMSFYTISTCSHLFSKAACLSPTIDIDIDQLTSFIRSCEMNPDCRIYMDYGSNEVKSKRGFANIIEDLLMINHEFQEHGCNTYPHIVLGGYHSEASWETQVPVFLRYLYPEIYR